jgi:hypothetical protein
MEVVQIPDGSGYFTIVAPDRGLLNPDYLYRRAQRREGAARLD